MTRLEDIIGRAIEIEIKGQKRPVVRAVLSAIICTEKAQQSRRYECEVLNFLFENKERLGILEVFEFKNLCVDGAIVLLGGKRIAVEIKYRMNWQKAMEATFEFKQFLQTEEAKTNPVHGAIVFFEKFDGSGWQRTPQCRVLQDGWNEWYRYFSKIDGIGSVDLIRLQNDLLGHYESEKVAASILALAESLPEEQREILRAAMFSDENPPRTI